MSTLLEIEQAAKRLSPAEQATLIQSLQEQSSRALGGRSSNGAERGEEEVVEWPDVEVRARAIFGDKVIPNMVLEERESADQ